MCNVGDKSMKKCPKCGKIKFIKEFYLLRDTNGDRHTLWCKECIEYYIEHISVGAN